MKTLTKNKTAETRLATLDQSDLTNDPHNNFHDSRNRLNDHKGPEDITYTIVKYGETFNRRHMTLTLAVVKVNRF